MWHYERERGTNTYTIRAPSGEWFAETNSARHAEYLVDLLNRAERGGTQPIVEAADGAVESYHSKAPA